MRNVILYIATSLDGYIADKNGSVDWLNGDASENENIGNYEEFIEKIDTVILGYKTYNQIISELSPDVWPYQGKKSYVLTHRECESNQEITFTSENLTHLINELQKQDGKDIWICGGASIANQALEANLIDEVFISIIPTILGDGTKLFDKQEKEQKLKFVSSNISNGIVEVRYYVIKQNR